MSSLILRNLILTVLSLALAALAVWQQQREVALALVAFVGGLWLRSGRAQDGETGGGAAVVALALLALSGCKLSAEYTPLGLLTDQVTMTPQASPTCASGKACFYAKSGDSRVYVRDPGGLELQSNSARSYRTSASCAGLSSPALGDVCYDTTLDEFLYYTANGWNPAVIEKPFIRSCTLTSAAASTPVTCLADASVPTGQKAYVAAWRAKVNGVTAWGTVATCTLRDSASVAFVTLPVASLTGNAFLNDNTSMITRADAYALNLGGTAAKGLEVVCDANGSGSDLVWTISGFIE